MYQVAPPIELPPGAAERVERLTARAIEVFGDDDSQPVWWYRADSALGCDEMGNLTPTRLAAQSEEGLQHLLEILDELALTVTPKWKPKLAKRRRR